MKKHTTTLILIGLLSITALGVLFAKEYTALLVPKHTLTQLTEATFIRLRLLSPNMVSTMTPDLDEQLDSCYLEIKDYVLRTDSNGFMVTTKNHETPDVKFAFFGGSTTACLLVDEDNRMPERVTRNIEKQTHKKINVWNCGQVGTHSYHSLNFLTNCTWDLHPDYAFFYGNANDIAMLMHYGTYNNTNPDKAMLFSFAEFDKRYKPKQGFIPAILSLFQPKPEKDDDYADIRGQALITDSAVIKAEVSRVFKTIIATCKANNIQPVIITQINNFSKLNHEWLLKNVPDIKPSKEEYKAIIAMFDLYNETLKEVALSNGALLIDLTSTSFPLTHFYSALH